MPEKSEKYEQIPLTLPVEPGTSREDLIESSANRKAVLLIDSWPDWPASVAILAGPVGSGKTHMAGIWAEIAGAKILPMSRLSELGPELDPGQNLVLEDAKAGEIDEEALFHLYNRMKAAGSALLITSREFPQGWQLQLPDLVSRIRTAHLVELAEPDDTLLSRILVKLFSDRQLQVDPALVDFLVQRMERSLGAAGEIVSWLDREALARRKRITKPLASEALQHFEQMHR